jgi:quinol monooxygenase YgiN
MPEIVSGAKHVTFINSFRCEPSNQDEVVRINIDIIDHVASTFPGFVSATVHRSADGTRVFNYLHWESAQHLAAMQRSPEFQAITGRFAGLIGFEPRVRSRPPPRARLTHRTRTGTRSRRRTEASRAAPHRRALRTKPNSPPRPVLTLASMGERMS